MECPRRFLSERAVEQYLPRGGRQEICPSDDFRDSACDIIDDDREFISRDVVAIPDHEVAKILQRHSLDRPVVPVMKTNPLTVGHPEPPVHTGGIRKREGLGRIIPPVPRKNCLVCVGCHRCGGDILAGPSAWVDPAPIAKMPPHSQILGSPIALKNRPLVPRDSQPPQVLDRRIGEFPCAPRGIQILNPQDQPAPGLSRPLKRLPECQRMADVKQSSRGRRHSPAIPAHPACNESFGPSSASWLQAEKISPSSKSSCGEIACFGRARTPRSAYSGWQSRQ